jgi:hypothetical protein
MRAGGTWKYNRLAQWDPVDAYVQKTSNHEPENGIDNQRNLHLAILFYLIGNLGGKSIDDFGLTIDDLKIVNRQSLIVNPESWVLLLI